jgi:uncharacterized protein YcnI
MRRFRKLLASLPALILLATPAIASAHVVVTPGTATVGSYTTFNVSVPNEKEVAVSEVTLTIPSGVKGATPTVKPGWTVTTDQTGEGEDAVVKSITWTAGSIPVGFRDDFTFRAQVPAKAAEIDWKALQTYADGTVVHWDQTPTASDDDSGDAGPYSVTKVVNDLAATTTADKSSTNDSGNTTLPLVLSLVAVVLSLGSILYRKK